MCIPEFYAPHFKIKVANKHPNKHPTNHYIPLHRGKHPMTHGVSPTTIPFPENRSSSCTWSLGITIEIDRGILIEAEVGVLAYEVTQAIHHMRVIGHKSETAIGTSAPGR